MKDTAMVMTALLLLTAGAVVHAQEAADDEALIRAARAASNAAIEDHDADAVASFWAEDYHLVASTNLQVAGREENLRSFASHLAEQPDVVYVRTPREIAVFLPWGMASEIGEWRGSWTDQEGEVRIGGTYLAKWQKAAGRWLIRAEVFVPTRCEGSSYCEARP